MKAALPLPQKRKIEIAVFPWHFIIKVVGSFGDEESVTARGIDGLNQFFEEYKLFVPKFSYYDLGNAKNIKGKPLTEAIVKDIWIEKGAFSKSQVNFDLIIKLGRQLQVDAVLISSFDLDYGRQTADIILIDLETKKAYSKAGRVFVKTLGADIKNLTENCFTDYVNDKYKSHPDYE
jgi:hypothetical protein